MKKIILFALLTLCTALFYLLNTDEEKSSNFEDEFQRNDSIQMEYLDIAETEKIVLNTYGFDLNGDGVSDKINVFQNNDNEYEFDKKHFGLPIEILKGTVNGFTEWEENENVIFRVQDTCVSEGLNSITFNGNYFIIEQQGCYDYNILVWSTLTFEGSNDEIFLHKYHETYFNKADHEQKIPSRFWTKKDFANVRFQDVSEKFLIQLRNKN